MASIARAYIEMDTLNHIRLAALHAKDSDWDGVKKYMNKININSVEDADLKELAEALDYILKHQ